MAYLKPQSPLMCHKTDIYFYPVTTRDQIIIDDNSKLNDYSVVSIKEETNTLLSTNWIENNGQYVQSIIVKDLIEDYNVEIKIAYTGDLDADLLINRSAGYIKYAKQDNDEIIFYCIENKPIVDIPIELEVYV